MDTGLYKTIEKCAEEIHNVYFNFDNTHPWDSQPDAMKACMMDLVVDVLKMLNRNGYVLGKWADVNETVDKKDQN